MLPGDSCIVCQTAVESGSRWAYLLSLRCYSRPRQLWSGACTQTHTEVLGYPSILLSIPASRQQFTTLSTRLCVLHWICEQLALSCSVLAPNPLSLWNSGTEIGTIAAAWSLHTIALSLTVPLAGMGSPSAVGLMHHSHSCEHLVSHVRVTFVWICHFKILVVYCRGWNVFSSNLLVY